MPPQPSSSSRAVPNEKKAKLARSYQELLDEFSSTELKTVGNYQLGRLIGKGSFGKVYLATHKLTNGSKVGCACVVALLRQMFERVRC